MFDEQPVRTLAAVAVACHAHEHPASLELLARHHELQIAIAEHATNGFIAFRHPEATVPQHDRAAAVFLLRDRSFEITIIERVILNLDGEALITRIERRPARHGPGFEHPVDFEAKVIVQTRRVVLLDDEARVFGRLDRARAARLCRLLEIAARTVLGEFLARHGHLSASRRADQKASALLAASARPSQPASCRRQHCGGALP